MPFGCCSRVCCCAGVDESDGEGAELSERLGIPLYSERAAFTERPLLRLVSAVAGAIAGGAVRLFSYGMLYYDAFALLFSVGASAALCVAFSVLGNREKRFTVYYEAALLAGVFCLVCRCASTAYSVSDLR